MKHDNKSKASQLRHSATEAILCYGDIHGNVTAFIFEKTDLPNLFESNTRQTSEGDEG